MANNNTSKDTREVNVKLKNHEALQVVDTITGEVKAPEVTEGKQKNVKRWIPNVQFYKTYPKAWDLLETQLSATEIKVAMKLAFMAKPVTNTLRPLNPETTTTELANILGQNRKTIRKIIDKLFSLGVIGMYQVGEIITDDDKDFYTKAELTKMDSEVRKYWIFNPYLSFNGKYIHNDVPNIFQHTYYAKVAV